MKKLLILFAITFISCSKFEQEHCWKIIYDNHLPTDTMCGMTKSEIKKLQDKYDGNCIGCYSFTYEKIR